MITHNAVIGGMAEREPALANGRIVSDRYNERRLVPGESHW